MDPGTCTYVSGNQTTDMEQRCINQYIEAFCSYDILKHEGSPENDADYETKCAVALADLCVKWSRVPKAIRDEGQLNPPPSLSN